MNILLVSAFFYPANTPRAHRTTELSLQLAREGHRVTVITNCNESVRSQFAAEHGITILPLYSSAAQVFQPGGKGWTGKLKNGGNRALSLFLDYPNIRHLPKVRRMLRNAAGYDLLISIAYPHAIHWGVAAAMNRRKPIAKVWIADCGDPYMGQENDTFRPPFYFSYLEKWFCRKANYLTVPTQGAIEGYYPEFRNKIKVIPQGFKFPDLAAAPPAKAGTAPRFVYGGIFIPGRRDPSEMLAYLVETKADYRFDIYTSTPDLAKPFADASAGRIRVHPVISRTEFLAELQQADFVVNFENAGHKQTPSKLIDYVMMQKPILSVKTGQPDTGVIEAFLQGDYRGGLVIENPEQYRIENVCHQFVALAGA